MRPCRSSAPTGVLISFLQSSTLLFSYSLLTMTNSKIQSTSAEATALTDKAKSAGQVNEDAPEPPHLIFRSKDCLKIIDTKPPFNSEHVLAKTSETCSRIDNVFCSEDGNYLAWCNNSDIICMKLDTKEVIFSEPNKYRTNCVYISPKSTKLVCYSTSTSGDNLHFWDLHTKSLQTAMPFHRASSWRPSFSMNEDICIIHLNNDLVFYTNGNFEKPKNKISHMKINDFSLSTASIHNSTYQHLYSKRQKNKAHHIAIYTAASSKSQPAIVKIYRYPNMTDCVTNKSFFKADRVKFIWSPSGNSLLLLCQSEFDSTGKSYYGEQTLQYMSIKDSSCFVKLPKDGPISHIEWQPTCDKDIFVCAYGFMPSSVSLFNSKCELIHDFEPGSFNTATFSPFGNLLAIYGFGNLTGQLNIWNIEKKKLVFSLKVPETTGLEWSADGQHFITYTTTPRLRVNNGYRLWNYSGNLLHEFCGSGDTNLELYETVWQPRPSLFKKPKCEATKPSKQNDLLSQSNLQKYQKVAAKYIPPSMRKTGRPESALNSAVGFDSANRAIVGLADLQQSSTNTKKTKPKPKKKPVDAKLDALIDETVKLEITEKPAPKPKRQQVKKTDVAKSAK